MIQLKRAHDDERGWVLVVAMAALTIMLLIGLALLTTADTQSQQSRKQRERDSAFNMAEAVLGNQIFILSRNWPAASTTAFNGACNQSGGVATQCPVDAQLRANFAQSDPSAGGISTQPDYLVAPNWKTAVYDDGTACGTDYSRYYTEALAACGGASHYDANDNNQVWVRAEAIVRGHTRVLIARAQVQKLTLPFPRFVVQAGSLSMHNGGVNTGSGGNVELRCTTGYTTGCADYSPSDVTPGSTTFGYSQPSALTPALKASLKATAKSEGHYCKIPSSALDSDSVSTGFTCTATGCPSDIGNTSGSGDGWIVWADGPTAQCKYNGSLQYNSSAKPGALVIGQGPGWIETTGTADYYGILYAVNRQNVSTPALIQWHGTGAVYGAVATDGNGTLDMCCSSHANFTFDANALGGVQVNGAAGIVQNTWRQLQ